MIMITEVTNATVWEVAMKVSYFSGINVEGRPLFSPIPSNSLTISSRGMRMGKGIGGCPLGLAKAALAAWVAAFFAYLIPFLIQM